MLPDLNQYDRGHVALHRNIRARLLDVRDFASIQAAINAGGTVHVPDGDYLVEQTIQCATDLVLSRNARLVAVGDIDVIKLAPGGSVHGGVIDCSVAETFTKSAVLLDGNDRFYFHRTTVSDVVFRGKGTGSAVRFQARQSADQFAYIFGATVSDFRVTGFEHAIWMEAVETGGVERWAAVNGNQVVNGCIVDCGYAIHLDRVETGTNDLLGIGGNQFANIQIQAAENSRRAVYCEGWHNQFSNIMVWDWQFAAEQIAIEFPARSKRNMISTGLYPWFLLDSGDTNRLITPDT